MSNFWGFHIQAQGVRDKPRLIEYHRRVKPPWTLVMNGDGLAMELKAASPSTNVISRHYFSDGTWYGATPEDYLNYLDRAQVSPDLWCFVENESGINPDWNIHLLQINARRSTPRKLVILNLAVGNPADSQEWASPKVEALLKLCDQYRAWVVCGLHEYFIGVPTSGFIGGAPNRAGVDIDQPGVGENLIPKAAWPQKERNIVRWHMGRFNLMVNTCLALGIPPPRGVLTEAGADDVSDVKAWAELLRKTPPYSSIRGWRSLFNQWSEWYPGQNPEQLYADMLQYAAAEIYAGSVVEGGCIYCYATPDPDWLQFDIEGSETLLKALESAQAEEKPEPDMPPKLFPKPENATEKVVARALIGMNVRYGPGAGFAKIGTKPMGEVQPGDYVRFWKVPGLPEQSWVYCKIEVSNGDYAQKEGWLYYPDFRHQRSSTKEIPVMKPEPAPLLSHTITVKFLAPAPHDKAFADWLHKQLEGAGELFRNLDQVHEFTYEVEES